VLLNRQSRIVIEKPIEDVRRLARGRRNHLGIERPELVGDRGLSSNGTGLLGKDATPPPATRKKPRFAGISTTSCRLAENFSF
jgi:hypothetical protein